MNAVIGTATTEWVRFFRDRIAMFSTIALPIVLVLLIGLSFGQGGSRIPVGLLVENPGPLGSGFVQAIESSPGLQTSQYTDPRDLYRDIRMGLLSGGVQVAGDGQPVQVYLQQTASDAGAVMSTVQAAAADVGTRAIVLDVLAEEVTPARAQRAVAAAEQSMPPVSVESRTVGMVDAMESNRFASAVPSQLMLFTFLNGLLGAAALVQARELGVFQRTLAAPRGLPVYLGGLGASRVAIALLQAAILIGMGILSFRIDFGDPVAWVPLVLVYGVICSAAGMLLGGLCRTTGQAVAIAVPLGIVMGMLGGTMWPLSVVPPVMRFIGHLTPQGWAMDAWNLIMNDGAGLGGIGRQMAVLVVFAVVLSALALWVLGRHARTGR